MLATENQVHMDKNHGWHMEQLHALAAADPGLIVATPFLLNMDFIIPVANAFMPGIPVMTSGIGTAGTAFVHLAVLASLYALLGRPLVRRWCAYRTYGADITGATEGGGLLPS